MGGRTSFDVCFCLGFDLNLNTFSRLDVKSLGRCIAVSKEWKEVAVSDALWEKHTRELWEGKVYIDPKALRPSLRPVEAFAISIRESRRTRLTMEEICSFTWTVHFKSNAPAYWLSMDPIYNGLPPMQRFFHPDGYVNPGSNDPVWGGHECNWKFVNVGGERVNVRINSWLSLQVERTPKWGWTMNNLLVTYSTPNCFPVGSPSESHGCQQSGTSICHYPKSRKE
ncbi:uncharacterized protein LOC131028689 [Cryptomeria japonica]|uniref:uncharacterized protein LOC131028689 n=1 Tax=Cryptomeria japonica TaxID=3369 RepID=UPI0027DA2B4B|nr:uncharacterized protein LOC131028689 [Cryptomeria japonica]